MANRRNRNKTKRSKSDVDPYTQRYRAASDAAKAARTRLREGKSEDREVVDVREARIHSVSLNPKGIGYIEVDGEPFGGRFPDSRGPQEAIRPEATSDSAPAPSARGTSSSEEQPSAESVAAAYRRLPAETQEFLFGKHTPTDEELVEFGKRDQWIREILARKADHQVFFEAEVNGLPTHVGTEDCFCSETNHHWKELGEI